MKCKICGFEEREKDTLDGLCLTCQENRISDNSIAMRCKYYNVECPEDAYCPNGALCHKAGV